MKKILNKIKEFGIVETITLIIYICIVFIIAIHHECYEDEAQSWLIARDLNPIQIFQQMKYEGHSVLWFYILAPFAHLGFPVQTQVFITCIFAIATVFLVLKKSPFNKILKIAITFSAGMIYFYSVIARPYCMIPFFLVCIAILYKDRKKHAYAYAILLSLLANTHVIMLPTAILLMIDFWGKELLLKHKEQSKEDKRKLMISLCILLIGIFIYVIIILQAIVNCQIVDNFNQMKNVSNIEIAVTLIKKAIKETISMLYGDSNVPVYYYIIVLVSFILCIFGTIRNLKQGLIFWIQLFFTIFIHAFFWFILPTRVFLVIYTLMFWIWIQKDMHKEKSKTKSLEIALIMLILISMPSGYKLAYQDIVSGFSTGKMMANYIEENIPEGSIFVCVDPELQQSVIAYLKKDEYKFYMASTQKYVTYITWDDEWINVSDSQKTEKIVEFLKNKYKNVYILSINETNIPSNAQFLYSTKGQLIEDSIYVREEIYSIYEIG